LKKTSFYPHQVSIRLLIILLLVVVLASIGTNYWLYSPGKSLDLNLGIRHHVSPPWIPESIEFAGELVSLDIPDVKERLQRELLINAYWESNTLFMMKMGARWLPLIDSLLRANGVPSDFKYLPIVESRLSNEISSKGAAGFWHLMPSTAKELGLIVNKEVDERYHPVLSTLAAIKYLKRARTIFGSWTMAAASYNRGMNGLRRAVNHQQQKNYYDIKLNEESSRYLFRVLAFKLLFEYPKKMGFYVRKRDLYELPDIRKEFVDRPTDWVRFSKRRGLSYKHFRIWNPWVQNKRFDNVTGKGITVWLLKNPIFANQVNGWDSIPNPKDSSDYIGWDPWADSLFLDKVE
jgi:peptidoglycan lytic transglycosylase D